MDNLDNNKKIMNILLNINKMEKISSKIKWQRNIINQNV